LGEVNFKSTIPISVV